MRQRLLTKLAATSQQVAMMISCFLSFVFTLVGACSFSLFGIACAVPMH